MIQKLRNLYIVVLVPAIAGLMLIFCLRSLNIARLEQPLFSIRIAPYVFIASVLFAVALPILLRSLFTHRIRRQQSISEEQFIKFERQCIYAALVTPYLMLVAYLFSLPRFHLAGTVLMTLYAVYYYYPSEKRIHFEKRLFRVK
jgi:hypothetical protein